MRTRVEVPLMAVALSLQLGCDFEFEGFGNSHAYEKDFHQTYPLQAGGKLSLENFNGSVEITGWNENSIRIDGKQYGATPELRDAIRIDIYTAPDTVRIRTIAPSERRGNAGASYVIKVPHKTELDRILSSNGAVKLAELESAARIKTSNGSVHGLNLRGSVDIVTSNGAVDLQDVEGPATVRTSNGRIRAEGMRGVVEAATSNGGIQAHLTAPVPHRRIKLETSNGRVELTMDQFNDNEIRASTSNGGVTLRLPASLSAAVRAHTSNSSIHCDFDVRKQGVNNKHHLEGVVGEGGPSIEVSTSNGAIHLAKL